MFKIIKYSFLTVMFPVLVSACASTSSNDTISTSKPEAKTVKVEKNKKKSKTLTHVFSANYTDVKAATLVALKINGFEITENTDTSIKGYRPNKMAVITVGSGGERIFVRLLKLDAESVQVDVRTKKTVFGYVGQKNWNDEIIESIKTELS